MECPGCRNEIPNQAHFCPNCSRKFKPPANSWAAWKPILLGAVGLYVFAVITTSLLNFFDRRGSSHAQERTAPDPNAAYTIVSSKGSSTFDDGFYELRIVTNNCVNASAVESALRAAHEVYWMKRPPDMKREITRFSVWAYRSAECAKDSLCVPIGMVHHFGENAKMELTVETAAIAAANAPPAERFGITEDQRKAMVHLNRRLFLKLDELAQKAYPNGGEDWLKFQKKNEDKAIADICRIAKINRTQFREITFEGESKRW